MLADELRTVIDAQRNLLNHLKAATTPGDASVAVAHSILASLEAIAARLEGRVVVSVEAAEGAIKVCDWHQRLAKNTFGIDVSPVVHQTREVFTKALSPKQGAIDQHYEYDHHDPADCRRAAEEMIGAAAGLCGSACGALADCDQDEVRGYRSVLLDHRCELNAIARALSALSTKEGESGE